MNATVTKIVDILFQDVEMSEEVTALKDEVMNNCQERFDDLMANGMEEDEAIAAVVDSLKGMDEVIGEYPKKRAEAPEPKDDSDAADEDSFLVYDSETGGWHWVFKRPINKLDISLHYEDVRIEPSADEFVHVEFMQDGRTMRVEQEADTLLIRREEASDAGRKNKHRRVEIHMDNWKGMSFGEIMQDAMRQATHFSMDWDGDATVCVQLPKQSAPALNHWSVSGDLRAEDVCFSSVSIRTTSGDATLDLPEGFRAGELKVNTTSGEVDVTGNAERVSMQTMSGDIEYEGEVGALELSTASGDAHFAGSAKSVRGKTISGDLSVTLRDVQTCEANVATTSGDVSVSVPRELRDRTRVNTTSVSGGIRNRCDCEDGSAVVTVNAKSISGDISIA